MPPLLLLSIFCAAAKALLSISACQQLSISAKEQKLNAEGILRTLQILLRRREVTTRLGGRYFFYSQFPYSYSESSLAAAAAAAGKNIQHLSKSIKSITQRNRETK